MVALPDFRAWQFHSGLERIRNSFHASIDAMEGSERQARAAHDAYLDSECDDREYDEDGILISSTSHELEFASFEATFGAQVVREAFVTSVFHYWERSARAWTNNHEADFPKLVKLVLAMGYPISPDLCLLNALNNLLKHNNPRRGKEVFEKRARFFRWSREPVGADWQSNLTLRNEDVESFLEAVRGSGPQYATPQS